MKKALLNICINSQNASKAKLSGQTKNEVLAKFAELIKKNKTKILFENKKDVLLALRKKLKENMIKRLELNEKKIDDLMIIKENIIVNYKNSNKNIETLKKSILYKEFSYE